MSDDEGFGGGGSGGDLMLPKATVLRAIKDLLPKGLRCSSETGNLIMECCMEFLRMLSDEANVLCTKQGKQTIGPDHVIKSLEELGFQKWINELNQSLNSHKEALKRKPRMKKNPMKDCGMTMEELIAEQRKLLAGGGASPPTAPKEATAEGEPPVKKAKTDP